MNITIEIENVYVGGPTIRVTETFDCPPMVSAVAGVWPSEDEAEQWAEEHLYPYTGTGRESGDAAYFVEVTACEEPGYVGLHFEWGL